MKMSNEEKLAREERPANLSTEKKSEDFFAWLR